LPYTGSSWMFNKTIDQAIVDVNSTEECANACLDTDNCWGYSWEATQVVAGICYLFKALPKIKKDCKECVSGEIPGKIYGGSNGPKICTGNATNILGLKSSKSDMGCLQHCANTQGCNYYSWMNSEAVFKNVCFMFKSCNETQLEENSVTRDCGIPPLPSQCYEYMTLTSRKRRVDYEFVYLSQYNSHSSRYRYNSFESNYNTGDRSRNYNGDWQGSQWYRIQEPAGLVIPEHAPGKYSCNALYSGWMNSTHPTEIGVTKTVQICFQNEDNECLKTKEAKVTHCNKYYVYYLSNTSSGNMKYCTSDSKQIKEVAELQDETMEEADNL